eukprot:1499968-Amphidinium_carterae.1
MSQCSLFRGDEGHVLLPGAAARLPARGARQLPHPPFMLCAPQAQNLSKLGKTLDAHTYTSKLLEGTGA